MDPQLDQELLRALRRAPNRSLGQLADEVGLPRTNFGRSLAHRLEEPLARLRDAGLVEQHGGRYQLSERGRRRLVDEALQRGEDA